MKFQYKIGLLISALFSLNIAAQDIHFSQTEYLPLHLNSAFAGAKYDLLANVNYRTQWGTVAKPYQTCAASVSSNLTPNSKKAIFAGGVDFYYDWSGDAKLKTNAVRLHFATQIRLAREHSLGLGAYGGWQTRTIDSERGEWASQYNGLEFDPSLPSGEDFMVSKQTGSKGAFDTGAGLLYRYYSNPESFKNDKEREVMVGFSAFHVNRPKYYFLSNSDERMYMRYSAFVSMSFAVPKTKISIKPSVYYHNQGPAHELLVGASVQYVFKESSKRTTFYKEVSGTIGLFYRNLDALIVQAYFDWQGLGIGLAYDANVFSSLLKSSSSFGGVEIALRYSIGDYNKRTYRSGGRLLD